jgi:hypothetical protein
MAASKHRGRPRLDKEAVKGAIVEICSAYAGPGRTIGARTTWTCPACDKKKLEAMQERGLAGCWNGACDVPTTTDAIGIIAFFEGLDPRADFARVLGRGHELLGLDAVTRRGAGGEAKSRPRPANTKGAESPYDPELLDATYTAIVAMCPPSRRDLAFWRRRGVLPETVRRGRFASVTPAKARAVVERLERELARKTLLSVPGFFVNGRGRLSFTLAGDYALIPYHDRERRITTLEGRAMTPEQERRPGKYVSLRGSGCHLYVFPGLPVDGIEAFTEGPIGAIVAAQEGVNVASIKGIRCHRGPGGGPLPELSGARFGSRMVPYIPDADDPPKPDVLKEAPKAARNLTGPHGGVPALAHLPRGMDLDEWLLSLPEGERKRRLRALLRDARALSPAADAADRKEMRA